MGAGQGPPMERGLGEGERVRGRKRSMALVVAVFLVVPVLGVLVLDGVMSTLYGGPGLFGTPQPTLVDVLEGRVAADERQAAIDLVQREGAALPYSPHALVVAQQIATRCWEGQNNWKVQEGFRLRCVAVSVRYIAWDGEFDAGAQQSGSALASQCTNVTRPDETLALGPGGYGSGGKWTCAEGTELAVLWAPTTGLDESHPLMGWYAATTTSREATRQVSGPDADQVVASLHSHEWFKTEQLTTTYYQDTP